MAHNLDLVERNVNSLHKKSSGKVFLSSVIAVRKSFVSDINAGFRLKTLWQSALTLSVWRKKCYFLSFLLPLVKIVVVHKTLDIILTKNLPTRLNEKTSEF